MAALATVHAQSVTVYSDAACTKQIQTIKFSASNTYQCMAINSQTAKGVKFSKTGFAYRGYNAWDSDYCAGDMAGG